MEIRHENDYSNQTEETFNKDDNLFERFVSYQNDLSNRIVASNPNLELIKTEPVLREHFQPGLGAGGMYSGRVIVKDKPRNLWQKIWGGRSLVGMFAEGLLDFDKQLVVVYDESVRQQVTEAVTELNSRLGFEFKVIPPREKRNYRLCFAKKTGVLMGDSRRYRPNTQLSSS